MTVGERKEQKFVALALADKNFAVPIRVRHHTLLIAVMRTSRGAHVNL